MASSESLAPSEGSDGRVAGAVAGAEPAFIRAIMCRRSDQDEDGSASEVQIQEEQAPCELICADSKLWPLMSRCTRFLDGFEHGEPPLVWSTSQNKNPSGSQICLHSFWVPLLEI